MILSLVGQYACAQQVPAVGQDPAAGPANTLGQEKLGKPPEDNTLEFLREQSVLLRPGQKQFDVGVDYTLVDRYFPDIAMPSQTLVQARIRRRLIETPIAFRFGLTDRIQPFVTMPFGWAGTEVSFIGGDDFANTGGIGDTNAGANILLHKSCGGSSDPTIVAMLGFTAPTGKAQPLSFLATPQTTLGEGYWAGYWNVLFINNYDPVVVFYGFGSRHQFAREYDGVDIQPGSQYTYRGGVGFAVNERVTLSTTLYGSYITEPLLNGERLQGATLEPIYLRFATTMTQQCRICEPFAEIGMTDDAAKARIGITWTF